MHDLVEDVLNWKTFYLSGRLQKPVCLPSNAFLVLFFSFQYLLLIYCFIDNREMILCKT